MGVPCSRRGQARWEFQPVRWDIISRDTGVVEGIDQDIAGMRNQLIHVSFALLLDRVWHVVQNDLPTLRAAIEKPREELR